MEIVIDLDRKRYSFLETISKTSSEVYLHFIGADAKYLTDFSYSLIFENSEIEFDKFSLESTEIIELPSSEKDKRFVFRLNEIMPDSTYILNIVVFKEDSAIFNKDISFTTEIPRPPFLSWIWNSQLLKWQPPIPLPDEINTYQWIDEKMEWYKVPEAPYDSWVWDDKILQWFAPVECPGDESDYFWNEESLSWELTIEFS